MSAPSDVLEFWLDQVGPEGWYAGGEELDQQVRDKFLPLWNSAMEGRFGFWLTYASGALAYVILMDQFPRNMFRGTAEAFASDAYANRAAKSAIRAGYDLKIDEPARQFFYMPLMHSENLCDQDRCVRLMTDRMPEGGPTNLLHAQAHRDIIRRFGRFPFRNAALSRANRACEDEFVANEGYGGTVQALQSA